VLLLVLLALGLHRLLARDKSRLQQLIAQGIAHRRRSSSIRADLREPAF
jgi:hypothetical protein